MKTFDQPGDQVIAAKADRVPSSPPANSEEVGVRGRTRSPLIRGWLLLPREHGAWGMVGLPFLAAVAIAPGVVFTIRTVAALLAVFSIFLLRDPLVALRRIQSDSRRPEAADQKLTATRSLFLSLAGLALSGIILLMTLPPFWVLLLGISGLALVIASVMIAMERVQREITSQMLGVAGLTGSCLAGYLAVHGALDRLAFSIWVMSAVHSIASVFVVRARLETILSRRRTARGPASSLFFRSAVGWQAAVWAALVAVALTGYPWLVVPFLFPGTLHAWELWQCRRGYELPLSMHRLGWLQLAASLVFYSLLVLAFRSQLLP